MQFGRISGSEVEDYVSLPLEQGELLEMTSVTGRIAGNDLCDGANCWKWSQDKTKLSKPNPHVSSLFEKASKCTIFGTLITKI